MLGDQCGGGVEDAVDSALSAILLWTAQRRLCGGSGGAGWSHAFHTMKVEKGPYY